MTVQSTAWNDVHRTVLARLTENLATGDRVVVAMSGGVDSSAVAALAVEAGLEVLGITLQLYDHGAMTGKKGACCAGLDIRDARRVCDVLDIPHYVLDYEQLFRQKVIQPFAESWDKGETPVPCTLCNQTVKFDDLLESARALGAKALLTGHYVRRECGRCGFELHTARDTRRDQSWFLWGTTQAQLDFCRFPLGHVPGKDFTRHVAASRQLPVARKPDSQDICFVTGRSYTETLEVLQPASTNAPGQGEIVHVSGRVLGHHTGIRHYTVGQRKGLGITWPTPLYVTNIDPGLQRVVVGSRDDLACSEVHLRDLRLLAPRDEPWGSAVAARLRSTGQSVPVANVQIQGGLARVILEQPEYGVAPGQACVFYQGTRILGGGWIMRPVPVSG
jgi:tRNA-specific 2-thiouridylase